MAKPAAVKAIADKCRAKARPDWSEAKDVAMERAVRRKFDLYPELNDAALSLARHGKLLYDLQNVSRAVQ
jgi:hypothetical protein